MVWPLNSNRRVARACARAVRSLFDTLEPRVMLSASPADLGTPITNYALPADEIDGDPIADGTHGHASVTGYTPAQIRHAYGIDNITFTSPSGTITGDGSGQTIAIIDAYNDPRFYSSSDTTNYPNSDLYRFCNQFGLPQFGSGGPTFSKINETGGTTYPSNNAGWAGEIALDVEWAHAIAPKANIMLVECNGTNSDLMDSGVTYAANHGASVISMSFGLTGANGKGVDDNSFESDFTHSGVTYLASTGDDAKPAGTPATSPNVLAIGGTSLTLNSDNTWKSETAWSDSGGGYSTLLAKPTWQNGITTVSDPNNKRMTPDVAFDANPNTGVAIYDSFGEGSLTAPWVQIGGTSVSSPCWAGLIAIADQGRAANSLGTLGTLAVHTTLYSMSSTYTYFHDITSGSNGYSAGIGYDLVTGIGSPLANTVINIIAGVAAAQTVSAPTGLALATASDTGVSSSDGITKMTTPTITGNAVANSTVKLYSGATQIGTGTATSGGTFSIPTSVLANGPSTITATATSGSTTSSASTGVNITIDTVAPTIGTMSFNPNATSMTITIPFSENVSSSLSNTSLSVSGVAGGFQSESFNSGANTAMYTFSGYSHGILPDGNYTASLPVANVTDMAGNHPAVPVSLNFFMFDGDANFDRYVNTLDFNALATNYGQTGKQYVSGDFNYDGTVNSTDFGILAAKFGANLAAAADVPQDSPPADSQTADSQYADATPASGTTTQSSVFSDEPVSQNLAGDVLT